MAWLLPSELTNCIWHAFYSLGDEKNGRVPKSKLKVLTANLGTVLKCLGVEKGLEDHRSTPDLCFDDFMYYLHKELFASCSLETKEQWHYQQQIEDVCWLICRKQLLRNVNTIPENCVSKLFRIYCLLAELKPCPQQIIQVVMAAEEVEFIARAFTVALGKEWDKADFTQLAKVIPSFKFPTFLALLEARVKGMHESGLDEAVQELFDTFVKDVIKKGYLCKKGNFFASWKENWFVLQPNTLGYYGSRNEKTKQGEIPLSSKCTVENVPESSNARPNRFKIVGRDKCFELSASDHKTKLQWILAIETAIEHAGMNETYQKRQAARRRAEREVAEQRRTEEENWIKQQKELFAKQYAELEAEKLARYAAEAVAKEQAALRESESQRLHELEEGKKELERLLEEERQAKRDEEIVRTLQARVLREEWEKRDELERLRDEQRLLLDEERQRREGLEVQTQENSHHLENALDKLRQLEDERQQLDSKLKEAQSKMVMAERAKDVLEAKLKVRERSLIPVAITNRGPAASNKVGRTPLEITSAKHLKQHSLSDGENED